MSITLRVTGEHNVANAALVAVTALRAGVPIEAIERGLSNFLGAPRRYQYRGAWRGVDVYEDYAHLPGEIAATLATARQTGYQRRTVVYQPHRVTRTQHLLAGPLGEAFVDATHLVVTDLYLAGEANLTGLSGEAVVVAIRRDAPDLDVTYAPTFDDVVHRLEATSSDSDVVLVLGAGDVGAVIARLPGGLQ